ncbi:hypothetical protein EB001_20275 [bacterium]|nr:hypothetical protein [bacterium]
MNKFFLTSAIVLALTGSAMALTTQDETHNGKTVAVPGAQKSRGVFAPAAQVTPHGVVATAPVGSDVDVDVDGNDIEIDVSPKSRGLLGVGFLGL